MSAAANGGRNCSLDGGRMGVYKLNDMRSNVFESKVKNIGRD